MFVTITTGIKFSRFDKCINIYILNFCDKRPLMRKNHYEVSEFFSFSNVLQQILHKSPDSKSKLTKAKQPWTWTRTLAEVALAFVKTLDPKILKNPSRVQVVKKSPGWVG